VQVLRFADREYSLTTETRVNTTAAGDQRSPSIAALAGGGFVVCWQSTDQDGSGVGIYAQRFDDAGLVAGAEYLVNSTTTAGDQFDPSAAGLGNGNLVTVWTSVGQDGSVGGVFGQITDPGGVPVGGEFQVNAYTLDEQRDAAVTALSGGGFAVCWTSRLQDGSGEGVYLRRFTAGGTPSGNPVRVNTVLTGDQKAPALAGLADGGLLVVWQSAQQDGSGFGIYAQRYNASGVAQGAEFRVNTTVTGHQLAPTVAALAGGGAVVSWASQNQDGSGYGIYARLLDANGSASGSEFLVNTTTASDQQAPRVTALTGGGFTVTWESRYQDGSGFGAYARSFDASGTPLSAEFRANPTTLGHQMAPVAAALANGGYALAWLGVGQDGDRGAVLGQVFDASGSIVGPVLVQGTPDDDIMNLSGNGALHAAGFAGDDTYVVNEAGDLVFESAGGGSDTVFASLDWTLGPEFEGLVLSGTASISGTGNALDNSIVGNAGANTLDGGAGADAMTGGSGNDTFYVDNLLDTVTELASGGVDTVYSSVTFLLSTGVERLVLTGSANSDGTGNGLANTLTGNGGNNSLVGNGSNDTIDVGAGNDTLTGGFGSDSMVGGSGDDAYVVADAGDLVSEASGEGNDRVISTVDWTLGANVESLLLDGTADLDGSGNNDDNTLDGNTGVNLLVGLDGDDAINGHEGADRLSGGLGNDTLYGGSGLSADVFRFDAALSGTTNVDLVADFQLSLDRINLDDDVFTAFNAGTSNSVAPGQFYKGAGITAAHDASDRLIYNTTTGDLYYDPDGTGASPAVLFAIIGTTTHASLTANSFLIVS
jgi:hypothetical protein